MRKYIVIVFLSYAFVVGAVLLRHWIKSPESVRIFFGMPTELPLRDNSTLVKYVSPGLPNVQVVTVDRKKLLSEARIKYMRNRRATAKARVEEWSGVERPTAFDSNHSWFGGRYDLKGVSRNEEGSISKKRLRLEDHNDLYVAWFMPGMDQDNPDSPIKVPSVEKLLGGEFKSLKEQIEAANKKMPDYLVEITILDHMGWILEGPVYARPIDRGPNTGFKNHRVDTSFGVCKALNIEASLRDPNSDDCKVTFLIRLVHKDKVQDDGDEINLPSWTVN